MTILSLSDKTAFFPDLVLSDAQLEAAIRRAEVLAQGPNGANRNLEIQSYREVHSVNTADQTFFLSYFPILLEPAPVIEVRRSGNAEFGRVIPPQDWLTLASDQYEIDTESGEVRLKFGTTVNRSSGFYGDWTSNLNARATEARIAYYSGFNFAANPPPFEVTEIKNIVAGIMLATTANPAYSQGITQFSLGKFYSTAYGGVSRLGGKDAANPAADYLLSLQKYQPRNYFI
jgi:hypothetical protein